MTLLILVNLSFKGQQANSTKKNEIENTKKVEKNPM